ncbi:Zn-ribbon domain-containing OB-fold protein [Propylenella binzhouense]|nr:OB-fold domain-containing protein [Propylenella binzhouense]
MMQAADRKIAAPIVNVETEPFWKAAAEGRFLIKRCTDCGKPHWYPRAVCPFCMSAATVWEEASGRGTIYSYSVARRAPEPYAVAYVTLEEGPTMLTNVVDCDLDALAFGQAVVVTFKPSDGGYPVPMFRPA